ncbi:hypothetical protein HWB92_gp086 [Serratia phage vB_SmaA_3M]|uniref:Uncharacterized protein n=1 Tax=Serratia phage vB_SmaA_3M TaxID=2419930 RepID=A0A3G2YS63_9CAUD|nr:hypothetical protein HWB92_gp086 [Serratia phage vB_SmaA_3M]AYP28344.1 hypothetical protein 3M_088 [Serratia phage vB_SmaA_3M]
MFSINSGLYRCQVCSHEYRDPSDRALTDKQYKYRVLLGTSEQFSYTVMGDSLSQIDLHILRLISHYDKDAKRPVRVVKTPSGYPEGTRSVKVTGYTRLVGRRMKSIRINLIPL